MTAALDLARARQLIAEAREELVCLRDMVTDEIRRLSGSDDVHAQAALGHLREPRPARRSRRRCATTIPRLG